MAPLFIKNRTCLLFFLFLFHLSIKVINEIRGRVLYINTLCLNALRGVKGNLIYGGLKREWLGYQDSNLGMPGSKPGALPLGDTPTKRNGSYDGIRTCDPNIMSVVL